MWVARAGGVPVAELLLLLLRVMDVGVGGRMWRGGDGDGGRAEHPCTRLRLRMRMCRCVDAQSEGRT